MNDEPGTFGELLDTFGYGSPRSGVTADVVLDRLDTDGWLDIPILNAGEGKLLLKGVTRSELMSVLDRPNMLYIGEDTDGDPHMVVDYDGIVDGFLAALNVEVADE